MVIDSKKSLLCLMKLRSETINFPDGEVIVNEITADEYMEIYSSGSVKNEAGEFDGAKFTAVLATRCVVDKKGARFLSDDDADLLRRGSSRVYTKIVQAVNRVNGLSEDHSKN